MKRLLYTCKFILSEVGRVEMRKMGYQVNK